MGAPATTARPANRRSRFERFIPVTAVYVLEDETWTSCDTLGCDDSGPAEVLVVPVAAYLAWNVGVVVCLLRRCVNAPSSLGERAFLKFVGIAAAVRLLWLIPTSLDPWWSGPWLTMMVALTVVTVAASALHAARLGRSTGQQPG